MLSLWLLLFAPLQPAREPPSLDHLAREALFQPEKSTITVEWFCSGATKPSRAIVAIKDIGSEWKSEIFELKLLHLSVAGRTAAPTVRKAVETALSQMNSPGVVAGRCRENGPALFLSGSFVEDGRHQPRTYRLMLAEARSGEP